MVMYLYALLISEVGRHILVTLVMDCLDHLAVHVLVPLEELGVVHSHPVSVSALYAKKIIHVQSLRLTKDH